MASGHEAASKTTSTRRGVEMLEDQVRGAAVTAAGEAIKELGVEFFHHEGWRFWVTDEAGKTVCTLRLTGS